MKTKIVLLNAKWVLTNTVRNFTSLVTRTCNQQWQNSVHPIKPAIVNNNPQELLKQLQARWNKKTFYLDEYVLLCAKHGRLDCMKTLFEFAKEKNPDAKIRVLDALNQSVEQYHNDCAAYLLPHVSARWQYESLNIALENNNHEFVKIFLNTLETSSSRWNYVLNTLEQHHSLPQLCVSQDHRFDQLAVHMNEREYTLCQDFFAQQQNLRISSCVHTTQDQTKSKRKM